MARCPVTPLLESSLERHTRGEAEPRDEFLARHPEHALALARRLDILASVGALAHTRDEPDARAAGLPDEFDGFRIVRMVARGGMGAIYEAIQTSLQRRVAIKVVLHGHAWHEKLRERFEREMAILARLDHNHIVTIFGSGYVGGMPYIAMEWLEGDTLEGDLPDPAALPDMRATIGILRRMLAIAVALDHVHGLGVIHRDIKPSNIIAKPDGSLVLLDFGLAQAAGAERVTMSGEFVGTLYYTPPEQAHGEAVDKRADVFALGATMFHLLTGRTPIHAASLPEYARRVHAGSMPAPRRLNRHLSKDVATILEHATALDPRDRYATAGDLAEDIRAVLEDRPIQALPVGRVTSGLRWCRRRPSAAGLVASLLIGLFLLANLGRQALAAKQQLREQERRDLLHETWAILTQGGIEEPRAHLARYLEEYDNDRDTWVLHLLAESAHPTSRGYASLRAEPQRLARLAAALDRVPAALRDEPAIQLLQTLRDRAEAPAPNGGAADPPPVPELATQDEARRLALVLARADRIQEASDILRPWVFSADADYRSLLAFALIHNPNPTVGAYRAAASALVLRPDDPLVMATLAILEHALATKTGDRPARNRALALMRRAYLLRETSRLIRHNYAYLLCEIKPAGFAEQAITLYDGILKDYPEWAETRFNYANLLRDPGKKKGKDSVAQLGRSLALYESIEAEYRARGGYWSNRAFVLNTLGRPRDAVQVLARANQIPDAIGTGANSSASRVRCKA